MALTKPDIVEAVQTEIGFTRNRSIDLVESLLETIKSTLESGDDVLVSGFGKLCVLEKRERRGREWAFGLLKEGRYSKSITEFEVFIKKYPDSKFSDNAQYWLGEANYVSRNYKIALNEFQRLIAKFPDSTKISGARLKIGYTYFELKNWSAASESLQQVIKLYPNTTVAKKANDRLQRMKREGHKQ